jgi:hypothetical protein
MGDMPNLRLEYAAPTEIRSAIRRKKIVSFFLRGIRIEAEPYLYGQAARTGSFVLLYWDLSGDQWNMCRLYEMREFRISERPFSLSPPRVGYDPYDRKIAGIDTSIRCCAT